MSFRHNNAYEYFMNDVKLEKVSVFCDLGVYIQDNFKFRRHVKIVTLKAMRMFGLIRRTMGNNVSIKCKKTCYWVI